MMENMPRGMGDETHHQGAALRRMRWGPPIVASSCRRVPAGLERFLEETARAFAAAGGRPDPGLLHEIRTRYDTEMVDDQR